MLLRRLAELLPVLAVTGGCLAKPSLVPQLFSIDPPAVQETGRLGGVYVVSVKKAQVSPLFEGRALVYRTGEHRLERDPYASFAAPPGDMLTGAIRAYLRNAAFARDVVEPGAELRADLLVEVYAAEISGDLRGADDPAAVLRLRFRVSTLGAEHDRGPPLFEKDYSCRTRVARRTADAIATAWNEGLTKVMKEFVGDLEAVLARAPPPAAPGAR
jgi:cholesterol transport system auxiliary component